MTRPTQTLGAILARPRVTRRLDGLVSGHPLTVITAPAGAGKTTAIRQLLERRPEPCVWLTMQPRLDDPAALAGALGAVIGAEETPSVLAAGSADPSRLAGAMADDLDTRPAVVVLDDAHLVRSPAAHSMLRGVAERLGPSPRLRGHRRSRGVPRVRCREHGVRQVALAWARPGSRFTLWGSMRRALAAARTMCLCSQTSTARGRVFAT